MSRMRSLQQEERPKLSIEPNGGEIEDRSAGAPPIELIVGLGNPGAAYAGTRHNVGFRVINRLGRELGIDVSKHTRVASTGEGQFEGRRLVLAKPRTFMNESGKAVNELLRRYKLAPQQMVLIFDDLDLPVGRVRVRESGGTGGNKGMRSIVGAAGTQEFPRIRIGIGRPLVGDNPTWEPEAIAAWVLSDPSPDQRRLLDEAVTVAAEAAVGCLRDGVEAAMNRFNRG